MIFKSLHVKLLSIYLLIVVLFIGFLGGTLTYSYKKHLITMRENDIIDCAEEIARMYANGDLQIINLENGQTIPVLKTTAKDFDASIQIANTTSKRLFYNMNDKEMTIYEKDELVSDEIYNTVCAQGQIYIKSNYYSDEMKSNVSTIAYPLHYANSGKDDKPWAILIIHSDLSSVNKAYSSIISNLWIPAVAVFLIGFVLIFFLVKGVVDRVKKLNFATQRIAKGKFDERIEIKEKDEIGQLAQGFNKMAEELALSDASKKDFVSNAAHELRSPMTSINGFVEGMLDGTIPLEKHEEYLKIVSSEVKRLTKLVKTMLDLSRIESGRDKLNLVDFDINELIRRVVIRFGQKIENKGILPEIEIGDEPLLVNADVDKIEEVLQNLLDNAIKFTEEGKCLYISSESEGEAVIVTVKDEGAGISSEELKFIWDRFYTVDKAHTGHKSGTGLGLPIVKSIIDQHGHSISVKSTLGVGTEFVFSLSKAKK